MRTVKLRPEPATIARGTIARGREHGWERAPQGASAETAPGPLAAGLHPWMAFLLEPWLAAIEQARPGNTHWLQETSAAMSACLAEWVDPTPSIERALENARTASDLLVACIDRAGWTNPDAQRQVARAAMGALIEALARAEASAGKAERGLGF
jgi:hypothetical protein